MKLFLLKIGLYFLLLLLALEGIVRVFHLYQDLPSLYIDKHGVQKNVPKQRGYAVTGNRKENFIEFNINDFGYNSYREFVPSKDKVEIALIGDSFIEGFNQHYYNSIGKKIEDRLEGVEVYEYGHGGYDMADQLHLIHAYKEDFELIDHIIIYLKFENDLKRSEYTPNHFYVDIMKSYRFKVRESIKLISYADRIGLFEPFRELRTKFKSAKDKLKKSPEIDDAMNLKYLENFKALVKTLGFDKVKTTFLLDKGKTHESFLDYCDLMEYKYIDIGTKLEASKRPTTLIYDKHWNNNGRSIVASAIAEYIKENK